MTEYDTACVYCSDYLDGFYVEPSPGLKYCSDECIIEERNDKLNIDNMIDNVDMETHIPMYSIIDPIIPARESKKPSGVKKSVRFILPESKSGPDSLHSFKHCLSPFLRPLSSSSLSSSLSSSSLSSVTNINQKTEPKLDLSAQKLDLNPLNPLNPGRTAEDYTRQFLSLFKLPPNVSIIK